MSEPSGDDAELARRLGDGFPALTHPGASSGESLFTGVGKICETAVRLTGADGAAAAILTSSTRVRELVYATDATAQQIDELQFIIGEGPCLDAFHANHPVRYPDLGDITDNRWPVFTVEAASLGVSALFAFPVTGAARPVGVLELYRRTPDGLDTREYSSARICANAIGRTLGSNWRARLEAADSSEAAIEAVVNAGFDVDDPADPFTRADVHVAAGMVAVQLAVSVEDALDRLRAYCYAQRRSISAVAADVIARRVSFHEQRDNPEDS